MGLGATSSQQPPSLVARTRTIRAVDRAGRIADCHALSQAAPIRCAQCILPRAGAASDIIMAPCCTPPGTYPEGCCGGRMAGDCMLWPACLYIPALGATNKWIFDMTPIGWGDTPSLPTSTPLPLPRAALPVPLLWPPRAVSRLAPPPLGIRCRLTTLAGT